MNGVSQNADRGRSTTMYIGVGALILIILLLLILVF
jgi:hypothetical protein